ncbi:vWA domain-containing protein [Streptomyces chattanoogensis]|uniref:von Willebrand factor A n=1 Tax=Streptomyces chattanoogensis TaxID=66876 RepID=A0A0N0H2J7_9ACTN|nr:VWA domain-containing protein [Streptomyces chattanoogensis]KPC65409.1 von Willebrand factor A [Streptomyces chattanoogensis]
MARRHRRGVVALLGGLLLTLAAAPLQTTPAAANAPAAPTTEGTGMVMVLDSSGSMAEKDGSGLTRIAAAGKAVGTVVDALPAGYPTGLRLYGADKPRGCDDTRLAQPVSPLDRAGLKRAVARVRPKGDTPIGLSLEKAARDLPKPSAGSIGKRTILLISDGEDNCQAPPPCKVAAQLAKANVDLHVDTIGFQVAGRARQQLECIAKSGNGRYYDAPDAEALARQLQRAGQLSADGYRFQGSKVRGTPTKSNAPGIAPGQYLDSIGPNEKRFYAVALDEASTADFSATVVPQPGAAVGLLDSLHTEIAYGIDSTCTSATSQFGQHEGGTPLTSGISRIPSEDGTGGCDKSGQYWFVVERKAAKDSDAARWPMEVMFHVEHPLKKGVMPAQSEPEYGAGGKNAPLPTGTPKDITGGTSFNDARTLTQGVWRDKVLPSQTLWYKVPVGWGQQLRYDLEFANEPTLKDGHSASISYGGTEVYTPARVPVGWGTGEFSPHVSYNGRPASLSMGTVPVAWSNRYESGINVAPVHDKGNFYIAVTLGAKASEIAQNPQIGVVLRVAVLGKAKAGPQAGAAVVRSEADGASGSPADGRQEGTGGWAAGPVVAAVSGGTGVLLLGGLAVAFLRARKKAQSSGGGSDAMRGGSW